MKEGINFVEHGLPEKSPSLSQLGPSPGYLIKISLFLLMPLVLLTIFNFILIRLLTRQNIKIAALEKKQQNLAGQESAIRSLLARQENLNLIRRQKSNLPQMVKLVREKIPADTRLSNLTILPSKLIISAKTPVGPSFAYFIQGLILSQLFSEVALTRSSFEESTGTFNFSLLCLTK